MIRWLRKFYIFWLPFIGLLLSCSSIVYPRHSLINQVIRARPGFDKMTNQICTEYSGDKCTEINVVQYDLADSEIRKTFVDLKFVCNVAGRRFHVCSDASGLCRSDEIISGGWFNRTREIKVVERLDLPLKIQFLIDSNTICASESSEIGQMMFLPGRNGELLSK